MTICYLGIGSNLGSRKENIKEALNKISRLKNTKILKISKVIETEPVACPAGQPKFLNCAIKIKTSLPATNLLRKLQKIEQELGRLKQHRRNTPRTIDLDILFYGDKIINRKELIVPHPKMFKRDFVLRPLSEII